MSCVPSMPIRFAKAHYTPGDGSQNVTTFEQRVPFADRKWQFRIRVPVVGLKADLNGDGMDDVDESGLGDVNMRFMTIPILNIPKRYGVALETDFLLGKEEKSNREGQAARQLALVIVADI